MNTEIIKLENAAKLLSEVRDAKDAKSLKDMASAAEYFAHKFHLGKDAEDSARFVKISAEAMMGQFLRETEKHPAGRPSKEIGPRIGPISKPARLSDLGISKNESANAQKLAVIAEKKPDVFQSIASGKIPRKAAEKEIKKQEKAVAKQAIPENLPDATDRYRIICADIAKVGDQVGDGTIDWIITDPPYPKEFLPVYTDLAVFARRVLKPGGSLICMTGQSFLPEVMQRLSDHLTYHWTLSYLTPGGQAAQIWDRKINNFWKPLLWFTKGKYAGDWIGDVCQSKPNDNDKSHHHWGQSESGMADIVERFTFPGQVICDPFCGGGTTGIVSVKMNRMFVGIDIDSDCVSQVVKRIALCLPAA